MNFSCDNCQRRYTIADERVRGKASVKIRCRNCQNLITVQGLPDPDDATNVVPLEEVERAHGQKVAQAAAAPQKAPSPVISAPKPQPIAPSSKAAPPPLPPSPPPAPPAPAGKPEWFVMVKGKQQGPMDLVALRAMNVAGTITSRSYVWKKGMPEWKRSEEVPEVAQAISPAAAAPPPVPTRELPAAELNFAALFDEAKGSGEGRKTQELATPEPEPAPAPAPKAEAPATKPKIAPLATPLPSPALLAELSSKLELDEDTIESDGASNDAGGAGVPSEALIDDVPTNVHVDPALGAQVVSPSKEELIAKAALSEEAKQAAVEDPFALLGGDPSQLPSPSESTAFFIAQAGVNKRNPPWKIAAFIAALVLIPAALLYGLSQAHVSALQITHVDESGKEVTESVFSVSGMSGLGKLLVGGKDKKASAPAKLLGGQTKPAVAQGNGPKGSQSGTAMPMNGLPHTSGGPSEKDLAALYGDSKKSDVGPKIRQNAEVQHTDTTSGGLSEEQIAKVFSQNQAAFQSCIEQSLRKNPNLKVPKFYLVATVASSGTVTSTHIDRKDVDSSDLGECLKGRAKRMVFSSFAGDEVQVEIPLIVGVAL